MWIWNLGPGLAVNQSNSSIFTHPLFFGAIGLLEQGHKQDACDTIIPFNTLTVDGTSVGFNLLFSFP